jgi:asparagine synthetase B (glutamine-hydrolysing)
LVGEDSPPAEAGMATAILSSLEAAVARMTQGVPRLSVLFSGGVDSSLVAWLSGRRVTTDLVTIGMEGSPDLGAAESGARALGMPITVRKVSDADLSAALVRWSPELEGSGPVARSVALCTALALEAAPQSRVGIGQGADELFYGYAHFEGLAEMRARDRASEDWERLMGSDWPRAQAIAERLRKELVSPFMDPVVVDAAHQADFGSHFAGGTRKSLLREVARRAGVPAELCERPKRAFQYSTRVHAALKRLPDGIR